MSEKKEFVELAALWTKEGKRGDFLCGKGEDGRMYFVFPNPSRKNDRSPEFWLKSADGDDAPVQKPKKSAWPKAFQSAEEREPGSDDDDESLL